MKYKFKEPEYISARPIEFKTPDSFWRYRLLQENVENHMILDEKLEKMKETEEFQTAFVKYMQDEFPDLFEKWFESLTPELQKDSELLSTKGRVKGNC